MEDILRIKLFQSSANYKKEETVDNKMTYPLPPFSTIIGALHDACRYKEYHEMELSIQGKYEAMVQKPYTDYCFLNSTQDDRGILVKMYHEDLLCTAFQKIASAKKPQGNSFREGTTIQVINEHLIKEYGDLKDLNDTIKKFKNKRLNPALNRIKVRKKSLADKKKAVEKNTYRFQAIEKREKEIKQIEKEIDDRIKQYEEKNYKKPISKFRTLTTSLKYYEILTNIELIIHVKSSRETLECIKENIYNLKSIGRSEDLVEVKEVCFVELKTSVKEDVKSAYAAYVDYRLVKNEDIISKTHKGISADGTKFYLNKNYTIVNNQRKFEKKKVVYLSGFCAGEESENIYFDMMHDRPLIVNFL